MRTCTEAPKCQVGLLLFAGETEGLAQFERLLSSSAQGSSVSSAFCASFSQQVSPWLAMGCLSPRRMYAEVCSRPFHCLNAQFCPVKLMDLLLILDRRRSQ